MSIVMAGMCNCYYCKNKLTTDDVDDFLQSFTTEVVEKVIRKCRGFRDLLENKATLTEFASRFDEFMNIGLPDEPENSQRRYILNQLSECFNTAVDFSDTMIKMENLYYFIKNNIISDRYTPAMPLYTNIITTYLFVDSFMNKELPNEIIEKINKINKAYEQSQKLSISNTSN